MALFGRKQQVIEETMQAPAPIAAGAPKAASVGRDLSHILKHARITEKATMNQQASVYTFDVAEGATKRDIVAAVRALYKVTPLKIAVVTVPSKVRRNVRTGKAGVKRGGKKAYVYLTKGQTLNLS